MTCPECRKNVDELMATYWNGHQWHRGCAVKFQQGQISKMEKKLKSSGISQIKYLEVQEEIKEAREDLKALKQIQKDENKDIQELGKIMIRRGFGKRIDTHKLLESGQITKKMIEKAEEIKELYSSD